MNKSLSADNRLSRAPFTFIVNIMVPGSPGFHLVMSWAAEADISEAAVPSSLSRHAHLDSSPVAHALISDRLSQLAHSFHSIHEEVSEGT